MKAYTMSATALTENGNKLKEVFLDKMVKEKQITVEQKDNMNDYCFVIAEKTMFGRIWDKFYWKDTDNDDMSIIIVKIIK